MARSTMTNLIALMRGYCDAGTVDYQIGTVNYWDNDRVQEVLDRHRFDFHREPLQPVINYISGGSIEYKEYRSRYAYLEETDGGTAVFIVEDSTGADKTSGYSVDYTRGIVNFDADQAGTVYYLTGRSYDVDAAAADIWRQKAGHAAKVYDVSTDGQRLSRSQIIEHCWQMADRYERRSMPSVITMDRDDMV